MNWLRALALLAVACLLSEGLSDDLAKAVVWGAALIGGGIVLTPGDRAIYSINAYNREERGRGAEE